MPTCDGTSGEILSYKIPYFSLLSFLHPISDLNQGYHFDRLPTAATMRFPNSLTGLTGCLTLFLQKAFSAPALQTRPLLSVFNDASCSGASKNQIGVPLYSRDTCLQLPGDGLRINYNDWADQCVGMITSIPLSAPTTQLKKGSC
jgi:hypothetical protein